MQLDPGIRGSDLAVERGDRGGAVGSPRRRLAGDRGDVTVTPIEALHGEGVNLDRDSIEPTAVLGGTVELQRAE